MNGFLLYTIVTNCDFGKTLGFYSTTLSLYCVVSIKRVLPNRRLINISNKYPLYFVVNFVLFLPQLTIFHTVYFFAYHLFLQ